MKIIPYRVRAGARQCCARGWPGRGAAARDTGRPAEPGAGDCAVPAVLHRAATLPVAARHPRRGAHIGRVRAALSAAGVRAQHWRGGPGSRLARCVRRNQFGGRVRDRAALPARRLPAGVQADAGLPAQPALQADQVGPDAARPAGHVRGAGARTVPDTAPAAPLPAPINEAKTKLMVATSADLPINNPNLRRRDVQIGERTFEVVPEFTYHRLTVTVN